MGEREIFPLMKWERILDLTEGFQFIRVPSPAASRDSTMLLGATSIGIVLLGIRMYEKILSFPHSLLNGCIIASSSFNNTSRKFVAPKCDFPSLGFFQHLSSK
jgi:xanthosine utilization system XapX-like protein